MAASAVVSTETTAGLGASRYTRRSLETLSNEDLAVIRQRIADVLDWRTRQFHLFEAVQIVAKPPELQPQLNSELAERLSPSQVDCWRDCQARWFFKYFRGLPEASDSKRALGQAVHAAIAANFRQKTETKKDLAREEFLNIYEEAWQRYSAEAVFAEGENPAEIGREGATLAQKYLLEAAPEIQPALVEQEVSGKIGGVRVKVFVDLMDTNGCVIELKTSSRKPSGVRASHAFQLATYTQITPGASGRCRIDTLVRTKTPQLHQKDYTVSDAEVRLTKAVYPLAQEGMRSGLYLPNRGSMFCNRTSCTFAAECEAEFGGRVE